MCFYLLQVIFCGQLQGKMFKILALCCVGFALNSVSAQTSNSPLNPLQCFTFKLLVNHAFNYSFQLKTVTWIWLSLWMDLAPLPLMHRARQPIGTQLFFSFKMQFLASQLDQKRLGRLLYDSTKGKMSNAKKLIVSGFNT